MAVGDLQTGGTEREKSSSSEEQRIHQQSELNGASSSAGRRGATITSGEENSSSQNRGSNSGSAGTDIHDDLIAIDREQECRDPFQPVTASTPVEISKFLKNPFTATFKAEELEMSYLEFIAPTSTFLTLSCAIPTFTYAGMSARYYLEGRGIDFIGFYIASCLAHALFAICLLLGNRFLAAGTQKARLAEVIMVVYTLWNGVLLHAISYISMEDCWNSSNKMIEDFRRCREILPLETPTPAIILLGLFPLRQKIASPLVLAIATTPFVIRPFFTNEPLAHWIPRVVYLLLTSGFALSYAVLREKYSRGSFEAFVETRRWENLTTGRQRELALTLKAIAGVDDIERFLVRDIPTDMSDKCTVGLIIIPNIATFFTSGFVRHTINDFDNHCQLVDAQRIRFGIQLLYATGDTYCVAHGLRRIAGDESTVTHDPQVVVDFAFIVQFSWKMILEKRHLRVSRNAARCGVASGKCEGGVVGRKRMYYVATGEANDGARRLAIAAPPSVIYVDEPTAAAINSDMIAFRKYTAEEACIPAACENEVVFVAQLPRGRPVSTLIRSEAINFLNSDADEDSEGQRIPEVPKLNGASIPDYPERKADRQVRIQAFLQEAKEEGEDMRNLPLQALGIDEEGEEDQASSMGGLLASLSSNIHSTVSIDRELRVLKEGKGSGISLRSTFEHLPLEDSFRQSATESAQDHWPALFSYTVTLAWLLLAIVMSLDPVGVPAVALPLTIVTTLLPGVLWPLRHLLREQKILSSVTIAIVFTQCVLMLIIVVVPFGEHFFALYNNDLVYYAFTVMFLLREASIGVPWEWASMVQLAFAIILGATDIAVNREVLRQFATFGVLILYMWCTRSQEGAHRAYFLYNRLPESRLRDSEQENLVQEVVLRKLMPAYIVPHVARRGITHDSKACIVANFGDVVILVVRLSNQRDFFAGYQQLPSAVGSDTRPNNRVTAVAGSTSNRDDTKMIGTGIHSVISSTLGVCTAMSELVYCTGDEAVLGGPFDEKKLKDVWQRSLASTAGFGGRTFAFSRALVADDVAVNMLECLQHIVQHSGNQRVTAVLARGDAVGHIVGNSPPRFEVTGPTMYRTRSLALNATEGFIGVTDKFHDLLPPAPTVEAVYASHGLRSGTAQRWRTRGVGFQCVIPLLVSDVK